MLKSENTPIQVYKDLACDMIQAMEDARFVRQIYAILFEQRRRQQEGGK